MPEPLEKQLSDRFSRVHRPVFKCLEPSVTSKSLAFPILYPKVVRWGGTLGGHILLEVR